MINKLAQVLQSNILGPSLNAVASLLGYKGRTTLYRIIDGSASDSAVSCFMDRLNEATGLDADGIERLVAVMEIGDELRRALIKERAALGDNWLHEAMLILATDDFDLLSEDFVSDTAPRLARFRAEDEDAYFEALMYVYALEMPGGFYRRGADCATLCGAALKPLFDFVVERHRESPMLRQMALGNINNPVLKYGAPNIWSLINWGSAFFKLMVSTDSLREGIFSLRLRPEFGERSYWRTGEEGVYMLIAAVMLERPGSGYYTCIQIDRTNPQPREIFAMKLLDENCCFLVKHAQAESTLVAYDVTEDELVFYTEHEETDPTGLGKHFTRIDLDSAPNLRKLDSQLDYFDILQLTCENEGFEIDDSDLADDILVSRRKITIVFESGMKASMDVDRYEWLREVTPQSGAYLVKRIVDGARCIIMNGCICLPLEQFEVTMPEQE